MVRKPQDVTDAELAVLQVLWDRGASTTRQLADVLYPGGTASQTATQDEPVAVHPSGTATVLKLLERLEGKGFVDRDRTGAVHVFEATIDREDLIERRLQALAESLCEGSRTPLLMHLVDPQKLTRDERDALRALVAELGDNGGASKSGKKK